MPSLIIFSGLPGTGKTTLSHRLAKEVGAVHLRIDTIEQALRDLCRIQVEGEGYRLAYRIAADNLVLGSDVIADSCNPLELTRREWEQVANDCAADYVNIEVICSDQNEHRRRVESRSTSIPNLRLPSWDDVMRREYHPWSTERVVVDTADRTTAEAYRDLVAVLRR